MSASKLLAIVVGSALLIGGTAAVSATGPGEIGADNAQVNDNADEAPTDDSSADSEELNESAGEGEANAGDERADRAGNQTVGPADGLPEQVPDHVSEIHDAIESFLNGTVADLGDALQDILGPDDASEDASADDGETTDDTAENDDEQEDEEANDDETTAAGNAPESVPA